MPTSERRALGRYDLLEPIATGTTATVWRARDPQRLEDVVIKRFHPHVVADERGRRRIAAEASNSRALDHPNICRSIDTISADGELALVFAHVRGTTLAGVLAAGGALPPATIADIAADIAAALAAAHARGVTIVTSSRRTSWSVTTAGHGCSTLAYRSRSPTRPPAPMP